ncbi:MAG TPA: hypothetical protein VFE50_25590 [Cyclobacteriaceae bacterium]|nr:hypothetical protein [Cyclobacteriaceae bacterium]
MKKLDDIPKKNIFKVPDGYFEELPAVIQARMAKEPKKSYFVPVVKYAVPVAAMLIAALIWFRPAASIESELDKIDSNQIALYLDNAYASDVDHEDESDWTTDELDALEQDVYSSMEYSVEEDILDDIDL